MMYEGRSPQGGAGGGDDYYKCACCGELEIDNTDNCNYNRRNPRPRKQE